MKKSIFLVSGTIAVLSIGLIALPIPSAALQEQEGTSPVVKVERLPRVRQLRRIQIDGDRVLQDAEQALEQSDGVLASVEALPDPEIEQATVFEGEEGPGGRGVGPPRG